MGLGMATHTSILASEVPWTEKPGGLWTTGLQKVGHNMVPKQQEGASVGEFPVEGKRHMFKQEGLE